MQAMSMVDLKNMFFYDLIKLAEEFPDTPALFYREHRQLCFKNYKQILVQVASCQKAYKDFSQMRFGIIGSNSWQWICNAWGVLAANKTLAFLDPVLSVEELAAAISRTNLEVIVIEEELHPLARELQNVLPRLMVTEYHVAEQEQENASLDLSNFDNGDTIFFTSGTSQNSKAVVTPISAIVGHAKAQQKLILHDPGDVVLNPLPLHHSFGFAKLIFWYLAKCPIIISSMKALLEDLGSLHVDRLMIVPSVAKFLLKMGAYPKTLKSVLISGSYLPQKLADEITAIGITVQNQYGSSELPCGIGESLPGDPVNYITLHETASVEISADGEIVVTDPFHFKEYYGDSKSTAETLTDGKVHTGDAGSLDSKGRLQLLGRKKNIILMENGEKLLCQDVDAELFALPNVYEAAAIYIEGELIAVISPKEGANRESILTSIEQYNRTKPYYRRIKHTWIYSGTLPYSSSGKLSRNRLEQEYKKLSPKDEQQL